MQSPSMHTSRYRFLHALVSTLAPSAVAAALTPKYSSAMKGKAYDSSPKPALLKFGVIADTQYVDLEKREVKGNLNKKTMKCDETRVRNYRHSLNILSEARRMFNAMHQDGELVHCILLGDAVDKQAKGQVSALQEIISRTSGPLQWHICVGNNDLQALSREDIFKYFIPSSAKVTSDGSQCSVDRLYYEFNPNPRIKFIFLDSYDFSVLSSCDGAKEFLKERNPLNVIEGLPEKDMRYQSYNGAVGDVQLAWLKRALANARKNNQRCVVFTHLPCHADVCRQDGLLWNADEVLSVLQKSGVVLAYITGHDHDGGYTVDAKGIHHITPPAPLECADSESAFGYIVIYDDMSFELKWTGKSPLYGSHACKWPPSA